MPSSKGHNRKSRYAWSGGSNGYRQPYNSSPAALPHLFTARRFSASRSGEVRLSYCSAA